MRRKFVSGALSVNLRSQGIIPWRSLKLLFIYPRQANVADALGNLSPRSIRMHVRLIHPGEINVPQLDTTSPPPYGLSYSLSRLRGRRRVPVVRQDRLALLLA